MILVFGGTSEGRETVKTLDEGNGSYFYSTLGSLQAIECVNGMHISGKMDSDDMTEFCLANNIRLIIDAAHPFAVNLHATIAETAAINKIPVLRFERIYPDYPDKGIIWCEDYNDAVDRMLRDNVKSLLALTGINTLPKLKEFWQKRKTWFRILDREDSFQKAIDMGFPEANLLFYEKDNLQEVVHRLVPEAIITKESGISGGFEEKLNVAVTNNLKFYVVKRPQLPDSFITVNGVNGLRREIERILPEFYTLHTGFTTGSCATAAAKAALLALISGQKPDNVSFRIPDGETMNMDIETTEILGNSAVASVIKEAGDDPDITDRCRIKAIVSYSDKPGIHFLGGQGIGTVTLPGLGLEPGEPAINPVPRQMISTELGKLYKNGLNVTLEVENGEGLAMKTFNPRVGIIGGISIIGTSGIVKPFSHIAFLDSIKRQFDVALALKCLPIVINSGAKSEAFMKALYPDLPPQAFIHYGNAIGETLAIAQQLGIKKLAIGIMPGKAVKLAEGHLDTHSHNVTLNLDFLKKIAIKVGCSSKTIHNLESLKLARTLPDILEVEDQNKFFIQLVSICHFNCKKIFLNSLHSFLIADNGEILAETETP